MQVSWYIGYPDPERVPTEIESYPQNTETTRGEGENPDDYTCPPFEKLFRG